MEQQEKKQRSRITENMVIASYDLGKRLKEGKIEFSEGVKQLVEVGMNRNSAIDYIYFYSKLMADERFTRTTNTFATNYFLDRILLEHGKEGLKSALGSLSKHLSYYEKKANVNVKSRREIFEKFKAKLKT